MIYWLIISYYHGGMTSIPEPNLAECERLAHWVDQRINSGGIHPDTYCLPGLSPVPTTPSEKP